MKKQLVLCMLAGVAGAAPIHAQDNVLEEVVVTAQRREQNLQEVPISVTAFTGSDIDKGNIRGATDYLSMTPNVSFTEDGQSGTRGLGISVRGVNNLITGENAFINSVGIYLDEFSVASVPNQVANPFLPDMQRLEVLRGPQGTYFGRNSVGGALNMVTNNPTDEFGLRLTLGGEDYENANEMFNITGIINAPLRDDFRVRGLIYYENSGGLVNNICAAGASAAQCPGVAENGSVANGVDDSGHEYVMGRLKAVWDVTDRTTAALTFIYSNEDQGTDENVPSGILDLDTTDSFGISVAEDPGTGFWPQNRNKNSHDYNEANLLDTMVVVLNVSHDISDSLTLKSITGVIDADQERRFDNDLVGGMDALRRDNTYSGTSWSTELRLESVSDSIDWVAGLLYASDDQEQDNNVHVGPHPTDTINGTGVLPPFPFGLGLLLNHKNFEVESIAVFGDLTWHVSNDLDVIVGGRYTHDNVFNSYDSFGIGPGPICFNDPACVAFLNDTTGTIPPPATFFPSFVNSPRPHAENEETFNDFAPRIAARLQLTDEIGLYVTGSKGYKAGGTSLGNRGDTSAALIAPFDSETLWNIEGGFKTELWDRRLRINGSIFQLWWKDLQMESFRFLVPGDLSSNFEQTINIENAQAIGTEIEFEALITENLTFSGGVGFLSTEITSASKAEITGGFVVDLKGLDLPKSPELTINMALNYDFELGGNPGWVRFEYIHRDEQYSDIEGLTNRQTLGPSPNAGLVRSMPLGEFPYLSPGFNVFNIRIGYQFRDFDFNVYVQNLGDETYYTGTQENFGVSGIRLRPHPRFFGGSVSYTFGGI